MTTFIEERIDDDLIIYDTTGGPGWVTTIVPVLSGDEKRRIRWSQARGRWELGERRLTKGELATLLAFFRTVAGRAIGFRFKDWADYSATAQAIGIGDGATTTFQLVKSYELGAVARLRTITKPVDGTLTVYVDLVEKTTGVSLDTTTGIVTLTPAPALDAVISADFEFDVPVRFDTDQFQSRFELYDVALDEAFHYLLSLPIVELRPAS